MLWLIGGAGAFAYAGPRLVVCLQACKEGGRLGCVMEFVIAIAIGMIAGEWVVPAASAWLGRTADYEVSALAVFIGLIANRASTGLVKIASAENMLRAILKSLGGPAR